MLIPVMFTCFESFVLSEYHFYLLILLSSLFGCSVSASRCTMSASLGAWEEENFFYKEDL